MKQHSDYISRSPQAEAAQARLALIVERGAEEQNTVLEEVMTMIIRDRLLEQRRMFFYRSDDGSTVKIGYRERDDNESFFKVSAHALTQLCNVAKYPSAFARTMSEGLEWEKQLVIDDLNTIYEKRPFLDRNRQPKKFLHRIVGDELRAFLSASYNPHLTTSKLIQPFLETCGEFGAGPVEARMTRSRVMVKCAMPYIFEPVDGEFVAFGSSLSNSDFGSGRLKISLVAIRASSNTITVVEDGYKRTHLGRILKDSDIEMDSETAKAELDTHRKAICNAVREQLKMETIEVFLDAIKAAAEYQIPWHNLKDKLRGLLAKKEVDLIEELLKKGADDIIDLPKPAIGANGDPVATKWWAANVVGFMARRQESDERRHELQALAGDLLGLKDSRAA